MNFSADNMAKMLSYLNMGGENVWLTKRYNLNASQTLANIPSAFAGADSDDVSMFYFAGHGVSGTSSRFGRSLRRPSYSLVLPTLLRNALNNVQGTVIVFAGSTPAAAALTSNLPARPQIPPKQMQTPSIARSSPHLPASLKKRES